ncbi:MAG: suppressor of fused domain protein, partial [Rikenellaceae bacterium]|nr:suppressor of fused domain protein [Rikenellaceae bacterium]
GEYDCLVFDHYKSGETEFNVGDRRHHLLLCLRIYRSEMEYARQNGSNVLIEKLKAAGLYPYSDLDREPIA